MPVVRVMAYDHQPYSKNAIGVPDKIADAQRQGALTWLEDIDARQIEWEVISCFVTR